MVTAWFFVPLVREASQLICSIDILFLRMNAPGSLIRAGDIDNRLKTLFDALRMPGNKSEMPGDPTDNEKPLFVLLEDDKLITHRSVETDELLQQVGDSWNDNHVRLVITVKIKPAVGILPFD